MGQVNKDFVLCVVTEPSTTQDVLLQCLSLIVLWLVKFRQYTQQSKWKP